MLARGFVENPFSLYIDNSRYLWPYLLYLDMRMYLLGINEMNISFTNKQEKYISEQVTEGDYQNASEVVRDALRLHEVYRHRVIEQLRAEVAKGWDGPDSTKSIKDIIAAKQAAR